MLPKIHLKEGFAILGFSRPAHAPARNFHCTCQFKRPEVQHLKSPKYHRSPLTKGTYGPTSADTGYMTKLPCMKYESGLGALVRDRPWFAYAINKLAGQLACHAHPS
eukprot:scaffold38285_cov19-Tisochrysis_lutea.AAC.1